MRISDWSSDVCSSDLRILALPILLAAVLAGCSTNSSKDLSAAQDLCAKAQHGDRSEAALAACTKIIDESDSRRDLSGAHNFRGIIYTKDRKSTRLNSSH